MGCYPLFACQDWHGLDADLRELATDLVCLSLVTTPFGQYDAELLARCFPEISRPFKEHFVVDLALPMRSYVSDHHQRNARLALRAVEVECSESPVHYGDEWVGLYANLIKRHNITGIAALSRRCLSLQLAVPGAIAFRARYDEQTVGMLIWYVSDEVAYYHLGAYSDAGYEVRASFALFWSAIEYFQRRGLRWLNLGAGAGVQQCGVDGLSRFKRGWSTGSRTAYFCGRIFNAEKYTALVNRAARPTTTYFPVYRFGEFS
jgi:hypothetical protein